MRKSVQVMLIVALFSFGGSLGAVEPFRVGVLRGPTAIAFAPMIADPPTMSGRPLEIEVFPSPDVLVARIISNDLDAAAIPSNLAVQLYNRDIQLEVVATFIWGVLYVVGPAGLTAGARPADQSLAELSGREVYVPGRGATPDLVFRYLLDREGTADVSVRYGFSQVEISQLLIAGRAEFAVLPEPFVTRVLSATQDRVVVADLQAEWREATGQDMPQTVLVAVGTAEPRERVALFEALGRSVGEVTGEPSVALSNVETLGLGLDTATAVSALPRLNLRVVSGRESRSALERYFDVLRGFDPASIGGSLPGADFYGLVR